MTIRYYKSEEGGLVVTSVGDNLLIKAGVISYMVPNVAVSTNPKVQEVEVDGNWSPQDVFNAISKNEQGK